MAAASCSSPSYVAQLLAALQLAAPHAACCSLLLPAMQFPVALCANLPAAFCSLQLFARACRETALNKNRVCIAQRRTVQLDPFRASNHAAYISLYIQLAVVWIFPNFGARQEHPIACALARMSNPLGHGFGLRRPRSEDRRHLEPVVVRTCPSPSC